MRKEQSFLSHLNPHALLFLKWPLWQNLIKKEHSHSCNFCVLGTKFKIDVIYCTYKNSRRSSQGGQKRTKAWKTLLPPSVREYYISLQELCGLGYTFKSKVPIEKLWGIFLCVPEVCPIIGGSFIGIVLWPCCTSIYRTVPCCSFAQFFAIEKKITCVAGIRSKWRRSWRNYCCCDVMWVYRSFAMRYWQWWWQY